MSKWCLAKLLPLLMLGKYLTNRTLHIKKLHYISKNTISYEVLLYGCKKMFILLWFRLSKALVKTFSAKIKSSNDNEALFRTFYSIHHPSFSLNY